MVLSLTSAAPNILRHQPNSADRSFRFLSLGNSHHLRFTKSLTIFANNNHISYPSVHRNLNLPAAAAVTPGDIFRQLVASSVLFLGLGFTFRASACPAVAPPLTSSEAHPLDTEPQDNGEGRQTTDVVDFEDEELQAAFEKWKTKTYALTVPLRIVSFNNSFPPIWIKDFLHAQGRKVKICPEFWHSCQDIFHELRIAFEKGVVNKKSAVVADVIALGDAWLTFSIKHGLIEPMQGVEDQEWFINRLSDKWKAYLRRSSDGRLDSQGKIWSAPFRWGSVVIVYKKREFRKRNLAPINDWDDLWRPELAGRISMVDSPREIIGAVLKYMGVSYNTKDLDSEVTGGRNAVQQNLASLVKQVRLFDSRNYLKAFGVEDVWVAVGWSSDVIPAARRISNVAVIVPKSGASLWADFWAIPAATRLASSDELGGRVRGPSPLVHQWIDFCLQSERQSPFNKGVIPGATPRRLETPTPVLEEEEEEGLGKRRPKLDTNLTASGVPPPEILSRCEFLEPLSDKALSDYQWLISSVHKEESSGSSFMGRTLQNVLSLFTNSFLRVAKSKDV
ncbi:hypothetical protein DM860_006834 [Cuscuta australis]|uniref:Uncharacterized protein n=1 Tax=Cuscuta australis TaxID=267555 RepID=A0A328E5A0_9ASTE|nr:hypothetical protein DM860_006834 [Cuscuta australis]